MTVKELIMSVTFEDLLPILKESESDHLDNIYAFREAYDILRNMEPNKKCQETILISTFFSQNERVINVVSNDDCWENELAKTIFFNGEFTPTITESAAHCLMELTHLGFSPICIKRLFNEQKPTKRYEVALDKFRESIWKHQIPRRLRVKHEDGSRWIKCDKTSKRNHRKNINRSKRKRKYRQDKRRRYLLTMIAREKIIFELSCPGSSFAYKDIEFLFGIKYGVRYVYNSVTYGKGNRLNYILESMVKYQQLDLTNYDSAVVFLHTPSEYPLNESETELFKEKVNGILGYKNILWGNVEDIYDSSDIQMILLLNKLK